MSLFGNSSNVYFNGSSVTNAYLNGNVVWSLLTETPTPTPTPTSIPLEPTQLLVNPNFDFGTTGWSASGGFGTWSYTLSNQVAVKDGVLYFTYVSRTVSQSVNVSSYILSSDSFSGVLNIKREENGTNNNDTYNFTLLFKNSSGVTVITKTTGSSIAPLNYTDITLTLNRSEIPSTFDTITTVEVQITGQDVGNWNGNHGPWVDYVNLNVTDYPDLTPTPTVTPTSTPTSTPTPTPTSTPTPTPEPLTGYSFNLIDLPYNFPITGNTIINNDPSIQTGSTNPNIFTTSGRGIYWNFIDSNGLDTTNYFSQFTGQSITITMTQDSSTVIYSGDTNSLKYWNGNTGTPPGTPGDGFVFGTGIGLPPTGSPSGIATLVQSGTTWNVGEPVYISISTNS